MALIGLGAPAAAAQGTGRGGSDQVHAYVDTLAMAGPDGRIARFEKAVCPAAFGLPGKLNDEITDRMRAVAKAAGAIVQPAGCKANILVFVPKDRKQLFAQLRSKRPELFGRLTAQQIAALENEAEPVVAWHIFEQRGADGRPLSGALREGQPLVQEAVTISRVLPSARSELDIATVVLDAKATLGMTTMQLADYALMRGIAQTRGATTGGLDAPTILAILRDKQLGQPAPLSVTALDLAFLKALYGAKNGEFQGAQRADIEAEMTRALPRS
jgi:hypothetical protein